MMSLARGFLFAHSLLFWSLLPRTAVATIGARTLQRVPEALGLTDAGWHLLPDAGRIIAEKLATDTQTRLQQFAARVRSAAGHAHLAAVDEAVDKGKLPTQALSIWDKEYQETKKQYCQTRHVRSGSRQYFTQKDSNTLLDPNVHSYKHWIPNKMKQAYFLDWWTCYVARKLLYPLTAAQLKPDYGHDQFAETALRIASKFLETANFPPNVVPIATATAGPGGSVVPPMQNGIAAAASHQQRNSFTALFACHTTTGDEEVSSASEGESRRSSSDAAAAAPSGQRRSCSTGRSRTKQKKQKRRAASKQEKGSELFRETWRAWTKEGKLARLPSCRSLFTGKSPDERVKLYRALSADWVERRADTLLDYQQDIFEELFVEPTARHVEKLKQAFEQIQTFSRLERLSVEDARTLQRILAEESALARQVDEGAKMYIRARNEGTAQIVAEQNAFAMLVRAGVVVDKTRTKSVRIEEASLEYVVSLQLFREDTTAAELLQNLKTVFAYSVYRATSYHGLVLEKFWKVAPPFLYTLLMYDAYKNGYPEMPAFLNTWSTKPPLQKVVMEFRHAALWVLEDGRKAAHDKVSLISPTYRAEWDRTDRYRDGMRQRQAEVRKLVDTVVDTADPRKDPRLATTWKDNEFARSAIDVLVKRKTIIKPKPVDIRSDIAKGGNSAVLKESDDIVRTAKHLLRTVYEAQWLLSNLQVRAVGLSLEEALPEDNREHLREELFRNWAEAAAKLSQRATLQVQKADSRGVPLPPVPVPAEVALRVRLPASMEGACQELLEQETQTGAAPAPGGRAKDEEDETRQKSESESAEEKAFDEGALRYAQLAKSEWPKFLDELWEPRKGMMQIMENFRKKKGSKDVFPNGVHPTWERVNSSLGGKNRTSAVGFLTNLDGHALAAVKRGHNSLL
ncbi:unnamed protein product [Amoebophrya sp. A120]|nr:unnamed protein product [Amoebophrya sp. A120]|eukprot:GSA120T00019443001.1